MLKRFLKDRKGATAIEYGLIAMLIAVAIVGSATQVGTQLKLLWGSTSDKVTEAVK